MIRLEAPAKINLRLRVLGSDESGYHGIETLFCAISLADELTISPADSGVSLEVEGQAPTEDPGENLVVRAARRFMQATGHERGFEIRLAKRIPTAAGLGGGSSDAAATLRVLRALQALRGRPADHSHLMAWAAELGSDVPFFLCGSPLALGWNRGENLLALPPLPPLPLLIAHPGSAFSTAEAFRRLDAARGPEFRTRPAAIHLREVQDWETLAPLAVNDFESIAFEAFPAVREALAILRESGAFIAMVAGSGASVFGVFHSVADRDAAEPALNDLGFDTWRVRTLETMPEPTAETPLTDLLPG